MFYHRIVLNINCGKLALTLNSLFNWFILVIFRLVSLHGQVGGCNLIPVFQTCILHPCSEYIV
jgi:hypothetical protein